MGAGNPVQRELLAAAAKTSTEIHVHLSRRWFERDPFARAAELYLRYASSTALVEQNGVLLYLNLRRRKFAIYVDQKPLTALGNQAWDQAGATLSELLSKESTEKAVLAIIQETGEKLASALPKLSA